MRKWLMRLLPAVAILGLGLGLIAGCAPAAKGETPEQFYQGKTITWVVSSGGAGDTTDMITRIVAPYLAKELGAAMKVENMGTDEGTNFVYTQVKADGLTLVSKDSAAFRNNDILKAPGVLYDIAKYNFIADLLPDNEAVVLSRRSQYKTLDDLRRA